MILFQMRGVVGLVLFAFWVWCVLDVIAMEASLMRNLPKSGWLFVVLFLPSVGGVAWVVLGRPERAGWRPGDTTYRKPFSTRFVARGPEDDPGFVAPTPTPPRSQRVSPADGSVDPKVDELEAREEELRKRELAIWEADLKRREEEQRRKEGGSGMYGGGRW